MSQELREDVKVINGMIKRLSEIHKRLDGGECSPLKHCPNRMLELASDSLEVWVDVIKKDYNLTDQSDKQLELGQETELEE